MDKPLFRYRPGSWSTGALVIAGHPPCLEEHEAHAPSKEEVRVDIVENGHVAGLGAEVLLRMLGWFRIVWLLNSKHRGHRLCAFPRDAR